MAKKNEEIIKAKALVCLKYNGEYVNIKKEFEVNKNDSKEMVDRGLIQLLESEPYNSGEGDSQLGEESSEKEGE